MLKTLLRTGAISILLTTAAVLAQDEQKFRNDQAEKLNQYAARAFDAGFPREAKIVWLMVIGNYDKDNEEARERLGYVRVGSSWTPDSTFRYPQQDNPDAAAARRLQSRWEALSKDLGESHKRMARSYEASRPDLAEEHYRHAIRFLPDDKEAKEALQFKPIEKLSGTDLEQTLYNRSKKIERAVELEREKTYEVTPLPISDTHPFLEKAGIEYRGVRSENFIIRGNWDEEALTEAAMFAERSYAVCKVAFDGFPGFRTQPPDSLFSYAIFDDRDIFKRVLLGNSDLFDKTTLDFLLEEVGATSVSDGQSMLRVAVSPTLDYLMDQAVRTVAWSASGVSSPGLTEGIGHAFVGMFFGNNRAFLVGREEREKRGTRGAEEDIIRYSPNMDTWADLVLEAAWEMTGTSAAQLPLIDAVSFPDDARFKAWSFCDYLIRRDPSLVLRLDALQDANNEFQVAERFTEATDGLSLEQLEREWKDFWTGASPVLKAIKGDTPPLTAVSRDAARWLAGFNEAREGHALLPVSWNSSFSARCKDHVDYLKANRRERGPAAEQTEKIDLEGASLEGSLFAQMALVSTEGRDPGRVFERWMDWPGYRDAILNKNLVAIGLYSDGQLMVMDGMRGANTQNALDWWTYPKRGQRSVPTEVLVSELGPAVQKLLEEEGHGGLRTLGYPLTLHFGQSVGSLKPNCTVRIRDELVPGIVHMTDGGKNRRTSAPGLVVFYPLEPLPRGAEVDVTWSFSAGSSLRRVSSPFLTR